MVLQCHDELAHNIQWPKLIYPWILGLFNILLMQPMKIVVILFYQWERSFVFMPIRALTYEKPPQLAAHFRIYDFFK